jgi:hypothetical protein
MDCLPASSKALLERLNAELERISEAQHRLARRKALLQEQATRLRLGASPATVRLTLEALAVLEPEELQMLRAEWPDMDGVSAARLG